MTETLESVIEWENRKREWASEHCSDVVFNLVHVNVRSLQKHWGMLQVYLDCTLLSLDALILTEIIVSQTECFQIFLNNFQLISLCREGRKGGGIGMFVRSSWLCERLDVQFSEAEVIAVSISKDCEDFLICCVYRPPNRDLSVFLNELHDFLSKHSCNKQVILVGDFNIDTFNSSKP